METRRAQKKKQFEVNENIFASISIRMKNFLIDTEMYTNAIKCIKNNSIKSPCFCCNYFKAAQNRDIFNLDL